MEKGLAPLRHNALAHKSITQAQTLRHGTFRCDKNKLVNFVLVPDGFVPESGTLVSEVLKAVGIPKPDLSFMFDKGSDIGSSVVVDRVRGVIDGITDACAQTNSLYLLRAPFRGNKLSEIVCESAQHGQCPVLGLFHRKNILRIDPTAQEDPRNEDFYKQLKKFHVYAKELKDKKKQASAEVVVKNPVEELPEWLQKKMGNSVLRAHLDGRRHGPTGGMRCDARRELLDNTALDEGANAISAKEVGVVIDISCKQTAIEEMATEHSVYDEIWDTRFPDAIRAGRALPLPLIDRVTHVVVFGDFEKTMHFSATFQKECPTGIIAAGGTGYLLSSAIGCIREAKPLFCFEGTGGSSDKISRLIQFGIMKQQKASDEELKDFFESKLQYGGGDGRHIKMTVQNFPEHFNPAAALVIRVADSDSFNLSHFSDKAGDSVDKLQDQIIRVMASVYSAVPELGGMEADVRSLRHAQQVCWHLLRAAKRYRMESTVLVVVMRILFVATAVSGVMLAQMEDSSTMFKQVGMALPLLVSLTATIFATYRPIQKFAAFSAAAHALKGEIYRFRTRTCPYHASKSTSSGKGHRQIFANKCDEVVATHLSAETRNGAAKLAEASTWGHTLVLSDSSGGTRLNQVAVAGSTLVRVQPKKEYIDSHGVGTGTNRTKISPEVADIGILSAEEYIASRALPAFRAVQHEAKWASIALKGLQLLAILGSSVCVLFQTTLPIWTPAVLAGVSTVEFFVSYAQLETHLPALNATALTIMRTLIWWDGLSLIQQRMPTNKDRFVDIVETALLMQHQGFVEGAISNLGKDLMAATETKEANGSNGSPAQQRPAAGGSEPVT
jgi:hypothetical protein